MILINAFKANFNNWYKRENFQVMLGSSKFAKDYNRWINKVNTAYQRALVDIEKPEL